MYEKNRTRNPKGTKMFEKNRPRTCTRKTDPEISKNNAPNMELEPTTPRLRQYFPSIDFDAGLSSWC